MGKILGNLLHAVPIALTRFAVLGFWKAFLVCAVQAISKLEDGPNPVVSRWADGGRKSIEKAIEWCKL